MILLTELVIRSSWTDMVSRAHHPLTHEGHPYSVRERNDGLTMPHIHLYILRIIIMNTFDCV